jgi:hypothetical protein
MDRFAIWRDGLRFRRCGWLIVAASIVACAEAPDGTAFFQPLESSVETPALDADIRGAEPPATPGGFIPDAIPLFPTRDASAPGVAPMLDAAISQPRDAGQDAGMPPPMMDAAGPPQDAAPGGTLPAPEAAVLAGQTCTTTPAYPTPDACSKCICSECASQVAICYASDEPAKNQLCKQVRDCAQANHCTGDRCYCDDPLCLIPSGPCAQVIQTAAGASDVGAAANDAQNPLGRSNQVGMCQMANCPTECEL